MQHLSDALHTAAAAPPPTSIDLDRLIAGEARTARRRRVAAMAGAALAVGALAAAVATGPNLGRVGNPAGPGPTGGGLSVPSDRKPVPTTPALTPEQRAEADRLAAALAQALTPILSAHSDWSFAPYGFIWEAQTGWTDAGTPLPGYTGAGVLTGPGDVQTKFWAVVRWAPMPTDTTCVKDSDPGIECTVQTEADGTQVWRGESREGGQHVRQAEVYRPDGVHVWISETAVGGQPLCLSVEELVALAHTPTLTLVS